VVQQTTADYLRDVLGWETVFACNQETFGAEGTLGRASDRKEVLGRYLQLKLMEFNPGLLAEAYREIVGFVNGTPLLFVELKNVHRDIRSAYEKNLADRTPDRVCSGGHRLR
jgi:hypothetical protein